MEATRWSSPLLSVSKNSRQNRTFLGKARYCKLPQSTVGTFVGKVLKRRVKAGSPYSQYRRMDRWKHIKASTIKCPASTIRPSYERGCQEKNSPLLPCEGKLFGLHPARCRFLRGCRLAAYILSVPRPVAGYISSVSCFRWWFDALGS